MTMMRNDYDARRLIQMRRRSVLWWKGGEVAMMRDVWKVFTQGCTECKNESFMAIRMRIHKNLCSSLTPGGYAKIYDCYVHIMVYLLLFLYCGALVECPGVFENKTLNSGIIFVVFFSCLKKFKCLGDVLDSVTAITVCHIEVPSFGRFYNLAEI